MAILKVAHLGNPILRQRAKTLSEEAIRSAEIQRLIDDMAETLYEYGGVGLAAPQVHRGVRLFLIEGPGEGEERVPLTVFINPVIVEASKEMEEDWEGCLSIPDLRGRVARHRRIRIAFTERNGERRTLEATGFAARVLQHEYDHLDGIVFLDRMRGLETLTFLKEFTRYWVEPLRETEPSDETDGNT